VNLTAWAHAQSVHVTTAYLSFREGMLPIVAPKAGRLILMRNWALKAVGCTECDVGPQAVLQAGSVPCGGGG
jgi:predicted site-specific integrase-resolvase